MRRFLFLFFGPFVLFFLIEFFEVVALVPFVPVFLAWFVLLAPRADFGFGVGRGGRRGEGRRLLLFGCCFAFAF